MGRWTEHLLDDAALNGGFEAEVSVRPQRWAFAIPSNDLETLRRMVGALCQVWAGSSAPLVPVLPTGEPDSLYQPILASEAVDSYRGFRMEGGRFHLDRFEWPLDGYGCPPSFAAYEFRADRKPLVRASLPPKDSPWFDIYLVCLGLLDESLDSGYAARLGYIPDITWEDYLEVERGELIGSAAELIEAINSERHISPRKHTLNKLAAGATYSDTQGPPWTQLPEARSDRRIAGPNVVVACQPGSVTDLALLWNLRAGSHADSAMPIGVPAQLHDSIDWDRLASAARAYRAERGKGRLYLTSTTLSSEELTSWGLDPRSVTVCDPSLLVTFGPSPFRPRTEIVNFDDGRTRLRSFSEGDAELAGSFTRLAGRWCVDLRMREYPLPNISGHRMRVPNGRISEGGLTRETSIAKPVQFQMPTRWQLTKAVARRNGLKARPSGAGTAAMTLIDQLGELEEIRMLLHEPLLVKLAEFAERQGMSWARRTVRERGITDIPLDGRIAPTAADLPEWTEAQLRPALGNSTKATRNWLQWAETKGLVIRGFPLKCPSCGSSDWLSVAAFRSPVRCRACGRQIDHPFSGPTVSFQFRISESVRRVFEHDAIGHVLTLYYLQRIFGGGDLIGLHPGVEFAPTVEGAGVLGEADVLVFFALAGFSPVEVKRSFAGFAQAGEVEKLSKLSLGLKAPWAATVVCGYGVDDSSGTKCALDSNWTGPPLYFFTYDQILESSILWTLGDTPLEWKPLTRDKIEERECEYIAMLTNVGDWDRNSWMDEELADTEHLF